MAVSEKEQKAVKDFYELAQEEKRLKPVKVDAIDVLYPYADWPAVLRFVGDKRIELWACELIPTEVKATKEVPAHTIYKGAKGIQVGTQDEYGRNKWLPGVMK